ncbi:hypothetical protein Egran_01336 [Elaphomyces granulatus]|uniref:FAD/NAD(P)-binding domain-containing protein n=1 Tax=Elaphomyces granulatus TaxID=519963 RepID=A0A232M3C9_9EURO|nr:hypothetical protein Egran_01336 [Elaphomyces granulatus]
MTRVRNIAVIGAGPSGLAAAKYLLAEDAFERIEIFEQRSKVGGVWNHHGKSVEDQLSMSIPHAQLDPKIPLEKPIWHAVNDAEERLEAIFLSPLYSGMETNIPKLLMQYSDQPFPPDEQLFPRSQIVLDYIEKYAEDIRSRIQFKNQVQEVVLDDPERSTWAVTWKNLQSGLTRTDRYDAVVVAAGKFDVPYLPYIEGIVTWNETYPGIISHSKYYDTPDPFHNKKVVIVGSAASAFDIGSQIAKVCRAPLLSSQRSESYFSFGPETDRVVCEVIAEFLSPTTHQRGIRFADGRIEEEIDAILFCTGYFYSYPFLSSLRPPVVGDGSRTLNVYQQMFYIDHPTMVFTILPQKIIPFPLAENQASVFARVWSGRLSLPSNTEMRVWEESFIAKNGSGRSFHLLRFPLDVDYHNFLYDWAASAMPKLGLASEGNGKMGSRWGEKERWMRYHFPEIKKKFLNKEEKRHSIRSLEELGFDFDEARAGWDALMAASISGSR